MGKPPARKKGNTIKDLKPPVLPKPGTSQDSLAQISRAQEEIARVKQNLDSLVDVLNDNASILTRAANFWGPLPIWQKAIVTVALFAPLITLGVLGNILALTVAAGVAAAAYMVGGLLIDNHYKGSKRCKENVKEGITCLANILEAMINALDEIRQQLASEVDKFKSENQRLSENVESLATVEGKLEIVTGQHEALVAEYERKVSELAEIKSSMIAENERLRLVGVTLQGALQTLSETVLADAEARTTFQKRLDEFITNSKASFDSVAERICTAEKELAGTKAALVSTSKQLAASNKRLEASNKLLKALLTEQAAQVTRLEKVAARSEEVLIQGVAPSKYRGKITLFRPETGGTLSKSDRLLEESTNGRGRARSLCS